MKEVCFTGTFPSKEIKAVCYTQEYFTCYFAPRRVQEPLLQLLASSSPLPALLSAVPEPAAPNHIVARSLQAYGKINPKSRFCVLKQ